MFLVVLLPPAAMLVWLGLGLLERDRTLEKQREIERLDANTETITRSLAQSLAEVERWFAGGQLPEGALGLIISSSGSSVSLQSQPTGSMLWMPTQVLLPKGANQPFIDAEKNEYQGDPEASLRVYQELAHSPDPLVQAGALLRVARVERNQGQIENALGAYRQLAAIRGIAIDGTPAELLARNEICRLLLDRGTKQEFHAQALASIGKRFSCGTLGVGSPRLET
jgi:hypothetical protein